MNKLIKHFFSQISYEYLILSIVLFLGFIVRLYKIDNPIADWHSWRQADTSSVTRIYVDKGIKVLHPRYHDISSIQTGIFNPEGYRMVEFPLYNVIHAFFFNKFSFLSLEIWGRLVSIVFAIGSSILLFLIGRKYLGVLGGLLAATFYSFLPFNIYFTRVILPEPMGVFWALLGLWLFMVFEDRRSNKLLCFSGISFALSLLVKPFFAIYLFPVFFYFYPKRKKEFLRIFAFLLIVFLPLFAWRYWVSNFPEGIPFFAWAFNGDRIRFHISFWRWIFGERLGILILGGWGLILFSISLIKKGEAFLKQLLLGALVYVSVVATASVRHDYYQIIIIPVVCLALSSGALFLWKNEFFNKYASRLLLLFSMFMMLLIGFYQVKDFYRINHPEIIEAGKKIDEMLPKDAIVIAPYNGDTAFLYQTKRSGWPAVDDSIENIIKKGAQYYVSVDLGSADTKDFEKKFETVEKTERYVILDLNKPLATKKK